MSVAPTSRGRCNNPCRQRRADACSCAHPRGRSREPFSIGLVSQNRRKLRTHEVMAGLLEARFLERPQAIEERIAPIRFAFAQQLVVAPPRRSGSSAVASRSQSTRSMSMPTGKGASASTLAPRAWLSEISAPPPRTIGCPVAPRMSGRPGSIVSIRCCRASDVTPRRSMSPSATTTLSQEGAPGSCKCWSATMPQRSLASGRRRGLHASSAGRACA